jgi:hypothetical protein
LADRSQQSCRGRHAAKKQCRRVQQAAAQSDRLPYSSDDADVPPEQVGL